jgi:hypothetical protein
LDKLLREIVSQVPRQSQKRVFQNKANHGSLILALPAETTTVPRVIVLKTLLVPPQKPANDAHLKTGCRFRGWPSMELKVVKDPHGSNHDTYPFLDSSNEYDKALIRNLLVYRLFLQKKGKQTTSWMNVVAHCNDSTTDGKPPVFGTGINMLAVKKHFSEYIAFMKAYREKNVKVKTGCDKNKAFLELLQGLLEDLFDFHESWKNQSDQKHASTVDARARDRAKGEAIRQAGLGLFIAAEAENNENDNPTPSNSNEKKGGHRLSGCFSAGENQQQSMEDLFQKHSKEKEETKRHHIKLEQERFSLEKQRIEEAHVGREMQHQLMMTLINQLNNK